MGLFDFAKKAFDEVEDFVTDDVVRMADEALGAFTEFSTLGLVDYEDGRITPGIVGKYGKEALDNITGKSQLKEMQRQSEAAVLREEERRAQALAEQRDLAMLSDIQASTNAQAIRSSSRSRQGSRARTTSSSDLGVEMDYLGL